MGKKKELTKYQKITIGIGIIGLIIGIGALLGTQLELPGLDPGEGGDIDLPIDDEGNLPSYYSPSFSTTTIEVYDITTTAFELKFYVLHGDNVNSMTATFYVEGVLDHIDTIGTPIGGWFDETFYKADFDGYVAESEITIDLVLIHTHPENGIGTDIEYDVVAGFSFYETPTPPPPPPEYEAPEITQGTFQFSTEGVIVTFSFATSNHDLINGFTFYFMINDVIVKDNLGHDVVKTMPGDGNGVYSGTFDYTQFDLAKITYIYLIMDFVNEDEEDEDRVYEEFSNFGGEEPTTTTTPTNGGGINYLFALIAAFVALTFFTINKKKKEAMKNG